jgi:GNAT superfamily N-acetyltransferase
MVQENAGVTIRVPGESDIPALISLIAQLGYEIDAETVARNLAIFAERPGHHVFVAEAGGRVAGVLALSIIQWFHRPEPGARITALVVDSAARGTGVGKALVRHAEDFAAEAGVILLELTSGLHRRKLGTYDFYVAQEYEDAKERSTLFRKDLMPKG